MVYTHKLNLKIKTKSGQDNMAVLIPVMAWDSRCSNCGSSDKVMNHREAELICRGCGLVLEDRMIDETFELRSYANLDAAAENMRYSYDKSGVLHSTIDSSTSKGKSLSYWNSKSIMSTSTHDAKTAKRAMDNMKEFEGYTNNASISEHALELAEEMFIALSSEKNFKGLNKRAAYGACVYFALQGKFTINEIELMFDIPKNFSKMCTQVQEILSGIDNKNKSWSSIFYDKEYKGNDGSDTIGRMVACQVDIPQNQMRFVSIQCKKVWDILKRDQLLTKNNGQGVNIAIIYSVCKAIGIAIQVEDIITFCADFGFSVCRNNFVENLNVVQKIVNSSEMSNARNMCGNKRKCI